MSISKIIFGAKNTDTQKLKEVVEIYAKEGTDIFDVCADKNIILLTRETINSLNLAQKPIICASITLGNDKHSAKAEITKEKCCGCGRCVNICPQKTIFLEKEYAKINENACVGCARCIEVCPNSAIKMFNLKQSFEEQYEQAKTADYIEIHTNGKDKNICEVFEFLKKNFNGKIGICISQNPNTKEKIEIITKVKDIIFPQKLIVQADGNSISGFDNEISTTQKAIEECKNYQNIENIILIASGGTNMKTAQLAQKEGIKLDGIAWGSYARGLLTEPDFLEKAIELLKSLDIRSSSLPNLAENFPTADNL